MYSTEGLGAGVLLDNVLTVDAVVRVSEEATGQYQVVPWLLVACVLVVLVECLLSEDRKDHAYTYAKCDGNARVCKSVVSHESEDSTDEVVLVEH